LGLRLSPAYRDIAVGLAGVEEIDDDGRQPEALADVARGCLSVRCVPDAGCDWVAYDILDGVRRGERVEAGETTGSAGFRAATTDRARRRVGSR
jgi:hypothetical protein